MFGRGLLVLTSGGAIIFTASSSYLLEIADNSLGEIISALISPTVKEVSSKTKEISEKAKEFESNSKKLETKSTIQKHVVKLKDGIDPEIYLRTSGKWKARLVGKNRKNDNKKIMPTRGRLSSSAISELLKAQQK